MTATDAPSTTTAAPERKRRARELGRTIALTARLAWQSEPRTFMLMIALAVLPAVVPPLMVELARRLVDLVSTGLDPDNRLVWLVAGLGLLAAAQRVTGT